jgi:hypothetical protein
MGCCKASKSLVRALVRPTSPLITNRVSNLLIPFPRLVSFRPLREGVEAEWIPSLP